MDKQQEREIINDSRIRFNRAFNNAGIKLNSSERAYLDVIIAEEVKTILTKCITGIPKVSPNQFMIKCNSSSVVGYHPINGTWKQLVQIIDKEGNVRYYTDGIQETKNLKEADGIQLKSDS